MPSQLGPKTLKAIDNELRAMRLRIKGCTFTQIAAELGFHTRSAAWKAVHRAKTARLVELAHLVDKLIIADGERHLQALERRTASLLGKPFVARCRRVGTLLTQEGWANGEKAGLHNVIQVRAARKRSATLSHGSAG
jgi:hypothetical protein